jgi:hypothetical protein
VQAMRQTGPKTRSMQSLSFQKCGWIMNNLER